MNTPNDNKIVVSDLYKAYGDLVAVDKISFEIDRGEVFGLVGPNGAGKSTTLRILATILNPMGGEISIFGKDIKKDAETIRKNITYLPEEAGAYKNMSGFSYLKFMATLYSDSKEERDQYIERAIEIADLGKRLKEPVKNYSKGMTRKLLLSRALMSQPQLAILDEPTSGLDVINSRFIRDTIKEYAKQGMAVLLSSHNMLEVEYMSDDVAIIDKGNIVDSGAPAELLKKHNANNLEEVFMNLTEKENE